MPLTESLSDWNEEKTLGLVGETGAGKNYNRKGDNENSAGCGS